ncbi:MAG: hypothetical protein CSB24_01020, partial [Deltaproteobacteria bacterium]
MSFNQYYSIDSLVEAGRQAAADKEIVSFDLFDTLVIRRVHDPDLIKLPVARYISALAKSFGITIGWRQVQQIRD